MATCKKCNNKYYSEECPHCKKIAWENKINKNNETINIKINKNIAIIITTIATSIIAIILIFNMYQDYKETQMIKKMFYGTTDDKKIEKQNKIIEKQIKEMQRKTNETLKMLNKRFKNPFENKR